MENRRVPGTTLFDVILPSARSSVIIRVWAFRIRDADKPRYWFVCVIFAVYLAECAEMRHVCEAIFTVMSKEKVLRFYSLVDVSYTSRNLSKNRINKVGVRVPVRVLCCYRAQGLRNTIRGTNERPESQRASKYRIVMYRTPFSLMEIPKLMNLIVVSDWYRG